MPRETRNLGHDKGTKIASVATPPSLSEGKDGDMQIYDGHLYIKDRNIWHHFVPKSQFNVAKPNKVDDDFTACFSAYNSSTDIDIPSNSSTWTTIDFDTEKFDVGDNFSGDIFTVPEAGKYFFTTTVTIYQQDVNYWLAVQIFAGNSADVEQDAFRTWSHPVSTGDFNSISVSCIIDSQAGDRVKVVAMGETGEGDGEFDVLLGAHQTFFMGYKIEQDLTSKVNAIIELLQLDIK